MTDLKVFKSTEFGELGVVMVNGREYFPVTQCAKLLGYANPRDAIQKHCKAEGVVNCDVLTNGGTQSMKYINEGNLYRLIVSSKLPAAEKFESWVFDEVLPSIRQNGCYGQSIDLERIISQTAAAVAAEFMKIACKGNVKKEENKRKVRKCTNIQPMKMELLPPEVKKKADDMIVSGEYSCQQIANYVMNTTGEYISQVAVNRYRARFFEFETESDQLSMF